MVKTPFDSARVIWSSSLEASPKFYDSEDWQLTKTEHSYESSKYQIDLIATNLDRIASNSNEGKRIRHFVSEPGVCSTSISRALVSGILDFIKTLSFYFVSSPYLYFLI
jgi:3-keto steroid reductase